MYSNMYSNGNLFIDTAIGTARESHQITPATLHTQFTLITVVCQVFKQKCALVDLHVFHFKIFIEIQKLILTVSKYN